MIYILEMLRHSIIFYFSFILFSNSLKIFIKFYLFMSFLVFIIFLKYFSKYIASFTNSYTVYQLKQYCKKCS